MSHTVKIATQFKTENMTSFRRALEHFGWKIEEKRKARTYPGDPAGNTVYPMIAVNPASNGYDIGLQINEQTGEIELYGDFFGGSIAKSLGSNVEGLKQEYSCCVIEDRLAYEGYVAARHTNEDGTIDIIAE